MVGRRQDQQRDMRQEGLRGCGFWFLESVGGKQPHPSKLKRADPQFGTCA